MPTVVIVDDSKLAAVVVKRILEPHDIQVVHADSAASLLGLKGKRPITSDAKPGAILLDIVMPEMDGMDVLRRLKARGDLAPIPVVMLTSAASEQNVLNALELGAVGFIAKPIDPDKLKVELARVTKGTPYEAIARALKDFLDPGRRAEETRDTLKFGHADLNYLYEILDGDTEMLKEMVGVFLDSCMQQIGDITKAVQDGHADNVRRAAHTFKGSVGNFGAPLVHDLAFEMEQMGREGELGNIQQKLDQLVPMVENLHEDLQNWVDSN
ncbi:response regulator [Acanthopleuribacter pedis]|uniref:Response regulator n=1 Tax=Acanthopleuribacter pedis TaxID=442870 RepID=A0A8J7Q7J5_9BACT|nr:response regulator [Acanthopleuribacter pedis]MBO1319801.1 response regulator [Acanthopleuribacter pedis]